MTDIDTTKMIKAFEKMRETSPLSKRELVKQNRDLHIWLALAVQSIETLLITQPGGGPHAPWWKAVRRAGEILDKIAPRGMVGLPEDDTALQSLADAVEDEVASGESHAEMLKGAVEHGQKAQGIRNVDRRR